MPRIGKGLTLQQTEDFFKGKHVQLDRQKVGESYDNKNIDRSNILPTAESYEPITQRVRSDPATQLDYAVQAQQEEEERMQNAADFPDLEEEEMAMLDENMLEEGAGRHNEDRTGIYENYNFDHQYDDNLPITKHRDDLLAVIEANPVTVIQGSTGSGKTTQVPQYVLDYSAKHKRYCNIVVTQPRRLAACSVAARVCDERNWQVGGICGFQVGRLQMVSDDTRLTYCTTGVLLANLIRAKRMDMYTHIFLDEVHERDTDTDFSLLLVRKLLRSISPSVKVILMSATLDSKLFSKYFGIKIGHEIQRAPVYTVEGRLFAVDEFYLESLQSLLPRGEKLPEINDPARFIDDKLLNLTVKLITKFDEIENRDPNNRGAVLVFLPGYVEIHEMHDHLYALRIIHRLKLLPLHSTITVDEQREVFKRPEPGERKIILSTNIAESSITVPDVRYVIDFCLTKHMVCDQQTNCPSLVVSFASKQNCTQRKGRAGRVAKGRVYRMVTKRVYDNCLSEHSTPEMQRCPLEQLVLRSKQLGMGAPTKILGLAMDPPPLHQIATTVLMLKEIGALSSSNMTHPHADPTDGELTYVGEILATLPVDVHIGKMIALGHVFGVLQHCLTMAAAMALKSFFARPFQHPLASFKAKFAWSVGSNSDGIAYLKAYNTWKRNKKDLFGSGAGQQTEAGWCRSNMIQKRRIHEVDELRRELEQRLEPFHIKDPDKSQSGGPFDPKDDEQLILKLVMAGAFYPNYFKVSPVNEEDALREMCGFDPRRTVRLNGLPCNSGAFYYDEIQKMFKDVESPMQIYFADSRAFIEFPLNVKPRPGLDIIQPYSSVPPAVLYALKIGNIGRRTALKVMDEQTSRMMGNQLKSLDKKNLEADEQGDSWPTKAKQSINERVEMPSPNVTHIPLFVWQLDQRDPTLMWVTYGDAETRNRLGNLQMQILQASLAPLRQPRVGQMCLAPFREMADAPPVFYRAQIQHISKNVCEVFYIDYGNTEHCDASSLRQLPEECKELRAQAFQIQLAEVRPPALNHGRWEDKVKNRLIDLLDQKSLIAKVYSLVDGVVRVTLLDHNHPTPLNINELLVAEHLADRCEEPLVSREDNENRETCRTFNRPYVNNTSMVDKRAESLRHRELAKQLMAAEEPSRPESIFLRGPFSPLQAQVSGLSSMAHIRQVVIDRDSVNSVSIVENPELEFSRLLISQYVATDSAGGKLRPSETTLMPAVPGLTAIMAMLWCPQLELRRDESKSRYTGVLCGLGKGASEKTPFLPEHDIEIEFPVHIDNIDLQMINTIRVAVNLMLGSRDSAEQCSVNAQQLRNIQGPTREQVLKLLRRERLPVKLTPYRRPFAWNQVPAEDIEDLSEAQEKLEGIPAFLPLVQALTLPGAIDITPKVPTAEDVQQHQEQQQQQQPIASEEDEALQQLFASTRKLHEAVEQARRERAEKLEGASSGTSQLVFPMKCVLCSYNIRDYRALLVHVMAASHKEREVQIGYMKI